MPLGARVIARQRAVPRSMKNYCCLLGAGGYIRVAYPRDLPGVYTKQAVNNNILIILLHNGTRRTY
jgi:hypothetical protein